MATPELEQQAHALYRFYDRAGDLLYVGLTNDPGRRWQRHSETQPWWHDVARIDIEAHPSRAAVREAERAAIQTERPRHNIRMNSGARRSEAKPRQPTWPPGHPVFAPGKVVALAFEDRTCPVGLTTRSDNTWVTLELYSWLIGQFSAGERSYRVDGIRSFAFAELMSDYAKRADGWSSSVTVYDMNPLGDFQTAWKKAGT